MVLKNIYDFCDRNKKYKVKFDKILTSKVLKATDYGDILDILCNFLLNVECTKDVAECFPQLLPALVSMAIPIEHVHLCSTDKDLIHKRNCVVLAKLISINPDLLTFVLNYFDVNPAPFESVEQIVTVPVKKRKLQDTYYPVSEVLDYDIVSACYNILSAAVTHFKHKWNWSKFYRFLRHNDNRVKWVALKCISIILGMSETIRLSCAMLLIDDTKPFLTKHEESILEPLALENLELTNDMFNNVLSVVPIGNVLLPVFNPDKVENDLKLVSVPSMEESLQSLAVAIASRKCICLQGSVGCGKTALVEYLAKVTGHDSSNFIKVQLGDQTDSKMLLGMYRCTDIPGEFVWQPGVLTQAVIAGKWLLLEDIDSAALDVASVLSNLLETGTLSVPGYRDNIYARSGFQLFVTQRLMPSITGLQKRMSSASSLLEKHWFCINVEGFSINELIILVQTLFPVLNTVASRMIDVFLLFSMGNHDGRSNAQENLFLKTGRQTSTRDLIKWCSRAVVDFNVSSPDSGLKIFQDAIDIFCCSVSDQGQRLHLIKAVADKLGIVKTKAEYFCNMYKPSINLLSDSFIAGRTRLLRKKSEYARMVQLKANFSFTRPSACLLERITCCVAQREPVLLVGETGTGKTSSIQYLARSTGHKLIVINMNQQSESADLLGGYKPVDLKFLMSPAREEFEILFRSYFAVEPNRKFLEHIALCYKQQKWKVLVTLMSHSTHAALKRLKASMTKESTLSKKNESSKKKRKDENNMDYQVQNNEELLRKWEKLAEKLKKLELQVKAQYSLAFSFVEGSLIKALREGHWVLLDEINLANAETLECLSGLLEKSSGSLSLLERGDSESIKRHPDFTIFACMNPATDIGKKDLPVGLRNRFTEFYVDELTERSDLQLLVNAYLKDMNLSADKQEAVVKFYLHVRKEALHTLLDGTGHKPHYSLRTLCRALSIAASNPCGNITRSLYEAFCLSFLTQLNYDSYPVVQKMIARAILTNKNMKAILGCPISKPKCEYDEDYICFEGYWIVKGTLVPNRPSNYILTETVRRNLKDLVRVVSIGKIPVLLQGDTSVGKTSLITYLAKASGHICVRINNHEHTDLQEYVGSYVADETGKLVFREGILVEAMRKGHWIILDELNLAPSDVLEALNRVLDDNRELFIPETQQVVKAHDNFMLFATQNPPGLYGGRKVLSRAFRNRFVELHFDEIPANELQVILHERCKMPQSYCKQVINVMTDLQIRRKSTATFAGKQGFITLRDLFRWGERYRLAPDVGDKLYDWSQHLADEGYLVLSAKVRKAEEADEIRQVIRKHLKRAVDPDTLFSLSDRTSPVTLHILQQILDKNNAYFKHIVWTYHMRRMAVLVKKSCQFKEPVLLVGETGCGKTTVCQLIAAMNGQTMRSINCHMHTESSDFLGNLRPVREHGNLETQKLFEWVDGPLIVAMQNGDLFLADEISLADDSVLERLNSLLEPERSLLLAEKGLELIVDGDDNSMVVADDKFVFIGTMNPGGDYGKKELSPALRNRFTEIWCEPCIAIDDLNDIIVHNLHKNLQSYKQSIAKAILSFIQWLPTTDVGKKLVVSIRDILTWVHFINICASSETIVKLNIGDAYYHGACLTYIDGLGSGLTSSEKLNKLSDFRDVALNQINNQIKHTLNEKLYSEEFKDGNDVTSYNSTNAFGIAPFYIMRGSCDTCEDKQFTFLTPTTKQNALKLLRALQLNKPLLLEGSPGVGKTSIVSALAKASGHALLRINLSDQTDISDLFGADLPVEGGQGGEFSWRDGPFLRALKAGDWILLDELNLASQSVLEGLNACFDHRGEIYIPELGKIFSVKPGTRLFGCQNPLKQGGARRGLPKSFLNRFTQVFIDALTEEDLMFILNVQFPELPTDLLQTMVKFNSTLALEIGVTWGHNGSPWELNLRDITRWCEATIRARNDNFTEFKNYYNPGNAVELIYVSRMRTQEDKQRVRRIYQECFPSEKYPLSPSECSVYITEEALYVDDVKLTLSQSAIYNNSNLLLLRDQRTTLKKLMQCVNMNWMSILVGASGCGKSNVVRLLASLVGQKLRCIVVNSAMDTTEILGGFEQTDYNRHLEELLERTEDLLLECLKRKIHKGDFEELAGYHGLLEKIKHLADDETDTARTMATETQLFLRKSNELSKLVSGMKTLEPSYEPMLQEIEAKLKALSMFVEQEKCLNAGGKFEWVDSVLVKCLRDGTWLLIDQVNLCSPAVLDRLNGLLEPNGVLTIGERGVDNHGNVVTIKPHKNFRLFLTMDPRYGEISRAMRNRGVEIYMLGPKENVDYDLVDLKSMLHNSGVTKCHHQAALLEIYERMSKEIVSVEKLNIVDLMHSAFLVARRLTRGFASRQAIRSACIDVYIKARSTRTPEIKEFLVSVIEEIIDACITQKINVDLDLDAVTWSIRNLQENSKLTILRQEGMFFKSAIETCEKLSNDLIPKSSYWNDFVGLSSKDCIEILNVNITELLPYLLLDFYERSTLEDVEIRNLWLAKMLTNGDTLKDLARTNKLLADEVLSFDFHTARRSLPWDLAFLPGIEPNNANEKVMNDANKLALLLYLRTMIIMDDTVLLDETFVDGKEKTMSVKQYSKAVYHDKLSLNLKNQPLITDFVKIIFQTNTCINSMLRDSSLTIDNEAYVELRQNLRHCNRFLELGEMTLINKLDKKMTNLEDISLLLRVNYRWLIKFIYKLHAACQSFILSEKATNEMNKLFAMVNEINHLLLSTHDPFRKITKMVKKQLVVPLPHISETSMDVHVRIRKVLKNFLPWDNQVMKVSSDQIIKQGIKIMTIQLNDTMSMRYKLISLWNNIYLNPILDDSILNDISQIEQFCESNYLGLNTQAEVSMALEKLNSIDSKEWITMSSNVQLWPIYEYLFLLSAYTSYRKICENSMDVTTGSQNLIENFSKIASIPANLISILSTIFTNEIDANQRMLLMAEFCVLLSQFTDNTYAIKDSKTLLHWNGKINDDAETSIVSYDAPKMHNFVGGAILMNLILELILQKEGQHQNDTILAATTLGTYAARTNQLNNLNSILWHNSVALTSRNYDIANNDFIVMKFYLNLYMSAVENMYSENDVDALITCAIEKQGKHKQSEMESTFYIEYLKPIEDLREVIEKLEYMETSDDALERGRTWMLIGYFELLVFGNLGYIDPVHKVSLKLKCLEEDIADCKAAIYINTLQSYILRTSLQNEDTHPRYLAIKRYLERIIKERDSLKLLKAYRPSSTSFTVFSKDIVNFRNTITSYEIVHKHIDRLMLAINKMIKHPSKESVKNAEGVLREAEMWHLSVQRFAEQIEFKYYSSYPDVVLPLLVALIHLKQGASLLINETQKRISSVVTDSEEGNLETFISNMARYPTIGTGQESLLRLVDTCTSDYAKVVIGKSLRLADTSVTVQEQFRAIKCGLYELYNYIVLNRDLSKSHWRTLNELLQQLVTIWRQQQEEAEKQAAEKESLYKNKSATQSQSINNDELIAELQSLFPTYREKDFSDIENASDANLERNVIPTETGECYGNIISSDDIKEIQQIHSTIVTSFINCKWIYRENDTIEPNYIRPLLQRYEIVHVLLKNTKCNLSEEFTSKLYNSLHMLVSQSLQTTQEEGTQQIMFGMIRAQKKSYDFYKDSNIQEAKQCLPLCECILNRINDLLKQWSEHPTLRSIKSIIERIYSFPVTSPVARFLTGLELLLVKLHQWEENAHSGVSLCTEILSLTQQIISWRKLELTCWKNCLDTAFENLRSQTSKWWFYLYALIESYVLKSVPKIATELLKEKESISKGKLVELLERFINESPLGEFETRLNLLLTFHCHVLYFEPSAEKEDLLSILWNIYNYYKQFINDVNKKIQAFKTPIEKKLKDFVKIARWNDISYWAVKETVEKTHRTLHKFVKEFENSLRQSVLSCLTVTVESCKADLEDGFKGDHSQKEYVISPDSFTISKTVKSKDIGTLATNCKYLSKIGTFLNKAKHLCKEIILLSSYPVIRMDIENFIQDYVEQSIHLKNMEIDRTLPKGKQKSQAKSILQQKKMTLANYFKALTLMGVSYRTGILTWKNSVDKVIDFTVPPLDISVVTKYFNLTNLDKQMLLQWSGCDKYYYKSIIKLNALNAVLRTSQTDLGAQNIERCRGFSTHIMLMANKQRSVLSKLFNHYMPLRMLVTNLSQIHDTNVTIPKQYNVQNCIKNLKELMINLELGFEQLLLYLECYPAELPFETQSNTFVLDTNTVPILNSGDNNTVLENVKTTLKENLALIRGIAKAFNSAFTFTKIKHMDNAQEVFNLYHLQSLEASYTQIEKLGEKMSTLINAFSSTNATHPMVESITFLETQIKHGINIFREVKKLSIDTSTDLLLEDFEIAKCKENLDNLIHHILLIVQKKYKTNTCDNDIPCIIIADDDDDDDNLDNDNNDNKDADDFEQDKLKEKLVDDLEKHIEELKVSKISKLFNNLLILVYQSKDYKRLLLKCLPIVEQYLLLVQFYLNEQVASFRVTCKLLYLQLNVFLDLATNGFCVPKDLDMEEGDGEGSEDKVQTGGMGLGEGEGQKDVSDRIESEDQLEDARRADEEEQKSEDKNCKEEEKGIEMSEDFDSKLQDMEKDENDEEDDKDNDTDDEDLDKQMGDTEEGAEQLDKEIWGDDQEESEDESNQPKDGEEQGQGEQIGDKEMTAKDGANKQDHDDEKEHHEDEQREEEKKEINEINEPEYNDDQIDPYHGKHQPQPEPEPLDLPDDMNLDDDDNAKEDNEGGDENPFDIDDMKDSKPLPEKENADPTEEKDEQEEKTDSQLDDDSSDEENNDGEQAENMDTEEKADENADPKGTSNEAQDTNQEDENKDEEMDEKQELQEKAAPSANDASKELDAVEQIDSSKDGSRDNVVQESQTEQNQETSTENSQEDSKNNGVGQSQSEHQESGHTGSSVDDTTTVSQQENKSKQINKRKNPGTADEDRSLFNKNELKTKKLKMIQSQEEMSEQEQEEQSTNKDDIDMCQHVKNSEKFDDYTMDAATENQIKQQASSNEEDEEKKEEEEIVDIDLQQDENEDPNKEEDNVPKQNPEKLAQDKKEQHKNDPTRKGGDTENSQMETNVEIEGDVVETVKVERGNETTFHTNIMDIGNNDTTNKSIETTRYEVEKMLSEWTYVPSTEEAAAAWNRLTAVTDSAARDLSEKLRLVLEPTQASRLKGDYRTGRRINMRKIIPYIASQFRKDKIWLRRTKPSKRDYQIVLALDDSSSMDDNHSKELAFESLSLISKAMTYLEVGQLCVMSFGERVSVLHPLGETFTEHSGSRLIQEMRFEQKKTLVGELVNFTVDMFETQHSSSDNAKLVVVLSDGRGIFSEGTDKVNQAVRRAKMADIFLVFIIVDNPLNKDSILDIRMPVFEDGKLLGIRSYMDNFPFPFYMILRDINTLPGVLSDALRQWFEVVGKIDT